MKNLKYFHLLFWLVITGFTGKSNAQTQRPNFEFQNRNIPFIAITQTELFEKQLPDRQESKGLKWNYVQNFISLAFAAYYNITTPKNQYADQLVDLEKDWFYFCSRRLASYSVIGSGTDVFRIKDSQNDGSWNDQGASERLTIHAPFWRTWWAYTLYGILLIAAGLLAGREILRRELLRATLKIKEIELDRLRELDTIKSNLFTNISHEFHRPLALIQGAVERLENKHPYSSDCGDYQLINRQAERLFELINQLLNLSKLEAGKLELNSQPAETTGQKEYAVPQSIQECSARPVISGMATCQPAGQVLVVKDQADLRHAISSQLSGHFLVQEAANGLLGYKLALDMVPDILIADVMMPVMDGIELCQKLKADRRTSHIPIILLTAKTDWKGKLNDLEIEADDYLIEPFKMEELLVRIKHLLDSQKNIRERFAKQIDVEPKEISVTSIDERFLQQAISILETNMANDRFDVNAFSKEIGLSRTHLHRKLTAITGHGPNELIRTVRLKRAVFLLQQHSGNVSDIAYSVGFSSLSYFTKCFKDFYGVPPSEYVRKGTPSDVPSL